MSVLKVNASARIDGSNSRIITQYIAESIGAPVVERDLVQQPLPAIAAQDLIDLHAGSDDPRQSLREHFAVSDTLVAELMAADTLVFGVPMYNFAIPASLKQWIDYVCRAGITFKYGETGPVGLTNIKRAFIVTASGGTPIGSEMDFASRYLEFICGFIGVDEVIQINASGSKGSPDVIIADAQAQIDEVMIAAPRVIDAGGV